MTPAARTQAAIELLTEIDSTERPADRVVAHYLRARRYIGGGDRRAIAALVYDVLRRRASLAWRLRQAGGAESPRTLVAAAVKADGEGGGGVEQCFDGSRYGPEPLSGEERAWLSAMPEDGAAMPQAARLDFPEWLAPAVGARFGDDAEAEMAAFNAPATLDLRINPLKADRDTVIGLLAAEGIDAGPTPYSPWGLRIDGRPPVASHAVYRDGLVEVQDEGAQLVALLCDAKPGDFVVDYCAGAGGKSLALAAAMKDSGKIVACDTEADRLARMEPRLNRAGVTIVEKLKLTTGGAPQSAAPDAADCVLLDMPCSGTGRWRRNPETKWRLTPEAVSAYVDRQHDILARARDLVRPGGRLVYATCSFLGEENEAVVERFLADDAAFEPIPVETVWAEVLDTPCPGSGPWLLLTPRRHGMDAFFVAVMRRSSA